MDVIIDIETQEPIPDNRGIEGMHVSIAGALVDGEMRFFDENELSGFFALLDKAGLIVGHNVIRFDYKVLQRYATFDVARRYRDRTFDIFHLILKKTDRRISLNDLAKRNLGLEKLGKGVDAPELFRAGRIDELKEYLAQDLRLTNDIFLHIKKHGQLKYGHVNYKEAVERTLPINPDER
jgi:hypothetical protein